jgi:hypothetical protein
MAKWVQHISGQGQKWKLVENQSDQWCWGTVVVGCSNYYLPKSEYVECDPPERWEDVRVRVASNGWSICGIEEDYNRIIAIPEPGYRFERVSENTFKIQKKVLDN